MSDCNKVSNLEVWSECGASNTSSSRHSKSNVIQASSSHHSSESSQIAAEAWSKAEAAWKRAEYAKFQIDMRVEWTQIDATLNALKEESVAEAAPAAAKVLEAAAENEGGKGEMAIGPPLSPAVSRQCTDDYINTHFSHQKEDKRETVNPLQAQYKDTLDDSQRMLQSILSLTTQCFKLPKATQYPISPHANVNAFSPNLQGNSTASSPHKVSDRLTPRSTDVSDLAAFLTRCDLLTAGFKVIDNRPENYMSLRYAFYNAIEGLNLKPSEELDLLTR